MSVRQHLQAKKESDAIFGATTTTPRGDKGHRLPVDTTPSSDEHIYSSADGTAQAQRPPPG